MAGIIEGLILAVSSLKDLGVLNLAVSSLEDLGVLNLAILGNY